MLRTFSNGLDWIARFLINLGCPFVVHHPPELRAALRKIARAVLRLAAESTVATELS
jgi:predicted DNA-binding transcriptional regulator YafY